ncbi:MAG: hypothetical protein Q7T82_20450 [Armatimonadota bacterium]|nr:hypothetical protein [Armatimonadota bacterium]
MFWTWDHSTEWALNRAGAQTLGASNYYGRRPETFIEDYTRLLQWCGKHHIDAVVVWGLLRDIHGGVESAKRLCDVAAKNGVRLLCGVGLNAYGGVYYEGNSPYSLEKHLEAHPELYGFDQAGNKMAFNFGLLGQKITHHACPSRGENQQFAADSLRWLFTQLPQIGGVQMETGDTGICRCKTCRERRTHPENEASLSWDDMALMYPIAAKAIRSVSPDALIVCETYSNPEPSPDPKKPQGFGENKAAWADECLAKFPEKVFVQWVGDSLSKPKNSVAWTDAGKVSNAPRSNIIRAHYSTYWMGQRGEIAVDWIADLAQKSTAHGMEGLSIFGEVSPFVAGAELNYLALENLGSASNPKASLEIFFRDVADPLLGGKKRGKQFLQLARTFGDGPRVADALKEIYPLCAKLPPDAARRWTWLANSLSSSVCTAG